MKKGYPTHKCHVVKNIREIIEFSSSVYGDNTYMKYKSGTSIKSVTYREFADMVKNIGEWLCSAGLCGKHVAIIGGTSVFYAAVYMAVVNTGGVIVPLDREVSKPEIEKFIDKSDSDVLFYASQFEETAREIFSTHPSMTFVRLSEEGTAQEGEPFYLITNIIEEGKRLTENGDSAYDDIVTDTSKPAAIIFTSGTTGTSKGVLLSQNNIVAAVNSSNRMIDMNENDVLLSVLPIHHTYEMTCEIFTPHLKGATVCINDSLKHIMKNLQLFKPTALILVPLFVTTIYKRIWDTAVKNGSDKKLNMGIKVSNYLRRAKIDVRSLVFKKVIAAFGGRLKKVVCGGAALSADYVNGFSDIGVEVVQGYGITECAPLISVCPFNWNRPGSVGIPVPGLEVYIDKKDGEREGEIVVRGDNVMMGYYGEPELTAEVLDADGWFKTGDIGYMDEDNFIYITGRKKTVIVLNNGKNVFPEEIEEHLYKNELICECLVVGKADKDGGIVVTALIYPNFPKAAEMGLEDILDVSAKIKSDIQQLNKELPSFKQIRGIEIRKKEFEKTTSKKIKRI